MYAIAFDLDQERLAAHYPGNTPSNAYDKIRTVLESAGFKWQQGSLYFGDASATNPVTAVLAIREIVKRHPWFKYVVNDIRMMRIEDTNDLMPAVGDYELEFTAPMTSAE